jgi:hypothetical protein
MTRSQTHLARHVTALITGAACKGRGLWWSQQEATHAQATTGADAAAATTDAFAVCGGCTQVDLCRQRAELDRYTGLAAGGVFLNGRVQDPTTVMPHPTPSQAQAS